MSFVPTIVVISSSSFLPPPPKQKNTHPSAPFLLATAASSGVSALASTLRSRRSSAQRIRVASWLPLLLLPLPFSLPSPSLPDTDGGASGSAPRMTLPAVPSSVSSSPSPNSQPPRLAVLARSSTESSETPQTQGLPLGKRRLFYRFLMKGEFFFLQPRGAAPLSSNLDCGR